MADLAPPSARQRGVALITALMVVALATITAVSLTASHQIDLRRAQTSQSLGQAELHARSLEALAAEVLSGLQLDEPRAREVLDERCRTPPISLEMNGALVEARLQDLHCRINVNNLADASDQETETAFIRLVEDLNRDHAEMQLDPEALVQRLREWIDPEVEDDWYRRQDPPYWPGNQPLASASELLLIRGMDEPAYRALEPYITALPEVGTPFNYLMAPDRLRDAYNLPDPEDMDPEAYGQGQYARIAATIRVDDRNHRRCAILHLGTGEVVLRRLRGC